MKPTVVEEDANTTTFGPEVKVLLEVNQSRKQKQGAGDAIPEVLQKTMEYCAKFSRFSNKQTVKQIRSLFPDDVYHEFEMAQLANLTCETAEEAHTLIPSLTRIPEDELQSKLNELAHLRKYQ